jgi:peptidyl-prolyl cis-trans isomerase C
LDKFAVFPWEIPYNLSMKKQALSKLLLTASLLGALSISQMTFASEPSKKANDVDFFATVNGTPLTNGLLELNIKAAQAQGQKDTPELKATLKEELINRELLTQEAIKQGLDKEIDFRDQIAQLKQTLMIQAFLEEHFQKDPISDAKLREEYDRQKKLLGEGASTNQYRLSQIIVSTETDALDLLRRIQKGELFGKLAQEYSIDPGSKANGGQIGWVLPGQIVAPVANVIVNLNKGAVANAPIQTQGGWVIVRVDDKRPFKFPTFEEAKPQLRQAIVQQYLAETVKKLRESAKIVQ